MQKSRAVRAAAGHGICDCCPHGRLSAHISANLRRHFGVLSTRRRSTQALTHVIRAANDIDDLQRSIQLAFAVPESHVASAIGYLIGEGPADGNFSDGVASMFEALATPQGWALCADLLRIRLELRAEKLRQTRDVEGFYKSLLKRNRSTS